MIWLLGAALAAPPLTWEGHAQTLIQDAPTAGPSSIGLGGSVGLRPLPALGVSLLAQGGLAAPRFDLRPEVRWFITPADPRGSLSLTAGYGLTVLPEVAPLGAAGVAWQRPIGAGLSLRVSARVLFQGAQPDGAQLAIGVTRDRIEPPPEIVVEPNPPPVEQDPTLPPEWVPYPVCEWLSPADAEQARLGVSLLEGVLPGTEGIGPLDDRDQGALVVVGESGDVIQLEGLQIDVSPQGTAVVAAPSGVLQAHVVGGGRRAAIETLITPGYVTWLRVPAPEPWHTTFDQGAADLNADQYAEIEQIAANLGNWDIELQGLFSPEGNLARNQALADRRAEAVRVALIDAGVDPERISVLPAPDQAPQGTDRELRATRLRFVSPEEQP
jgi:hypothetical protein